MDQADLELRETILKIWPFTAKDKIRLLVPTVQGRIIVFFYTKKIRQLFKCKEETLIIYLIGGAS